MPKPKDYQLRIMSESDLEMVLDWRNSDRVRQNMYTDCLISLNGSTGFKGISKSNEKDKLII